jgi:glycosyltransferase involved in cell wall biosynthesis
MNRRKIAYFSPLPPVHSGIAEYSEDLLPKLAEYFDIDIYIDRYEPATPLKGKFPIRPYTDYRPASGGGYDMHIYQMGNNPYHLYLYDFIFEHPGIVVLHDLVLHHFYVEATLARDLRGEYVALMEETYGPAGLKTARGRADGLFTEFQYFFFPLYETIAAASRGVLVHNRYALSAIAAEFPDMKAARVRMGIPAAPLPVDIRTARRALGFPEDAFILGSYGFVTTIKRLDVVLRAFARLLCKRPDSRFLIIGETTAGYDLKKEVMRLGLSDSVLLTGFLPQEALSTTLAAVDIFVNLRYPTAGETSASLLKLLAMGKPAMVSNIRQFRELPDHCCPKIDPGPLEEELLCRYFELLAGDRELLEALSAFGLEYIRDNHRVEDTAAEYRDFIEEVIADRDRRPPWRRIRPHPVRTSALPNLLRAEIRGTPVPENLPAGARVGIRCRVTNTGDTVWLSPSSPIGGQVALGGRILTGDGVLAAELPWRKLPFDVPPGRTFEIDCHLSVPADPGEYRVVIDLVDAGIGWFAETGSKPLSFVVNVPAS